MEEVGGNRFPLSDSCLETVGGYQKFQDATDYHLKHPVLQE